MNDPGMSAAESGYASMPWSANQTSPWGAFDTTSTPLTPS